MAFDNTVVAHSKQADVTLINDTRTQDLVVGCVLAVVGNLLISVSLNIQKYTHVTNEESVSQTHYTRRPLWWLGFVLMVGGEVGNFSAYGFAPASLVAPLGTTTVIANMFIAVSLLKEKLRPEDLFGSTLAVVGAVLLVTFSSRTETTLDVDGIVEHLQETAFIVYICIEIVLLIILFVLKLKFRIVNVLILLLITSILASCTVISAKAVSAMLQRTFVGPSQLQYPIFWFMLVVMLTTGIAQVKYLNQAMKSFNSTTVVPTNFVFFTISAIVAGIIFYREFWGMAAFEVCMFLLGCLLCFVGVYFITAGRTAVTRVKSAGVVAQEVPSGPAGPTAYTDIIPSWLLSPIGEVAVQPKQPAAAAAAADSPHGDSMSEDKCPLMTAMEDEKTAQQIAPPGVNTQNHYGATHSG